MWGAQWVASSSPRELPLQALTEPDVTLSRHPALIVQPFAHSGNSCGSRSAKRFCSGHLLLPYQVGLRPHMNDSTPSLRPRYRASSLLRVDPPQCSASILSLLQIGYLSFSLSIGATDSHVPHESMCWSRAASTPVADRTVCRSSSDLLFPRRDRTSVLTTFIVFSTPLMRFMFFTSPART